MKTELKDSILKKIKNNHLNSFSCYDFTDLAVYKTISKCLERMEDNGEIIRVIDGVYCLNVFDSQLNVPIYPSIDNIVQTIARKHVWTICPTGNTALNMMGLSTQVVANYSYLTNGPYKKYIIWENEITLKRTTSREINNYSLKTLLLIQCIKSIGNGMTSEEKELIKQKLSQKEKEVAFKETTHVQTWIRNIIVEICKEKQ